MPLLLAVMIYTDKPYGQYFSVMRYLLWLVLIHWVVPIQAQTTVTVGYYLQQPWWYLNQQQQLAGARYDAVKCVFSQMGDAQLRTLELPWARSQAYLRSGEVDAIVATASQRSQAYAQLSTPFIKSSWQFLYDGERHNFQDLAQLKRNAVVAARHGTRKYRFLKNNDYQVSGKPKTIQALLQFLLLKNRADAVLESASVLDYHLQAMNFEQSKLMRITVKQRPTGVYFSKVFLRKHPGFLPRFNQHITPCNQL